MKSTYRYDSTNPSIPFNDATSTEDSATTLQLDHNTPHFPYSSNSNRSCKRSGTTNLEGLKPSRGRDPKGRVMLRRYVSFHLFTFFYYQITIAPTDIPGAPLTHSILLTGLSISDSLNHPEICTTGFPTTVIIPDSRSFRYWTMTITDSYPER